MDNVLDCVGGYLVPIISPPARDRCEYVVEDVLVGLEEVLRGGAGGRPCAGKTPYSPWFEFSNNVELRELLAKARAAPASAAL